MDQNDTGIDPAQPLARGCTAMRRTIVHDPKHSFAGTVWFLRQHLLDQSAKGGYAGQASAGGGTDRKSTRLNSSHSQISYAVFCLKKKKKNTIARVHRSIISIECSCLLNRRAETRHGT